MDITPWTRRPNWVVDAACRGLDANIFFPSNCDHKGMAMARAICADCLVRVECLRHALDTQEKSGVYGGKSERERRKMRSGRALAIKRCRWLKCGRVFVPRHGGQWYCSPEHQVASLAERKRVKARRAS